MTASITGRRRPLARCGSDLALERAHCLRLLLERAGAQHGAAHARAARHQLAQHERDLGAGAQADDHDASLHRDRAQVVGEVRSPDELEDDVRPAPVRGRQHAVGEALVARPARRPARARARRRPRCAPCRARARRSATADLNGGAAHAARGAVHEQRLARAQRGLAADRVVRGDERLRAPRPRPARRARPAPRRRSAGARARGRRAHRRPRGRRRDRPASSPAPARRRPRPCPRPRAPGCPAGCPEAPGYEPSRCDRSAGLSPACVTRTSSSSLPGTGSGRSSRRITSLPPAPAKTTARTSAPLVVNRVRQRERPRTSGPAGRAICEHPGDERASRPSGCRDHRRRRVGASTAFHLADGRRRRTSSCSSARRSPAARPRARPAARACSSPTSSTCSCRCAAWTSSSAGTR